ncbi:MAG: DUF4175 family protein [Candidatus Eisenbacteria bacterium]
MNAHNAEHGHRELVRRISAAGDRWKRQTALVGLLCLASAMIGALTLLVVLEARIGLPPDVRVAWLAGALLLLLAGAWFWVARPLVRYVDAVDLAARVEERLPELGERLESSAELWEKRGTGRHGYSIELIDALILRTVAEAAGVEFRIAPRPEHTRRVVRVSVGVILVAAAGLAVLGSSLQPALARLKHPLHVPDAPVVRFRVEPGNVTLVSGDDLNVTASIEGTFRGLPTLAFEFDGEAPSTREMTPSEIMAVRETGFPVKATLSDIRSRLVYSVMAGGHSSQTYTVSVVEYPFVTNIRLDYEFPRYSALLPRTVDENSGDITALRGTSVGVTVTASKPIASAELVVDGGDRIPMSSLSPRSFAATVTVRTDVGYSIELEDADGLANPDPPRYSIVAIRDEHPLVKIVQPGADGEAPRGMVLPVVMSAIDDYGISTLSLRYSLEGSSEEGIVRLEEPGVAGPRELIRETAWDLSETGLLPGRSLVYYAEVTDNDQVMGPKSSRSESYIVRFPSMSELYSDVQGEHDDIAYELGELLEEQQVLREQFEDMQEEIRSEPEIDWQEEEQVNDALERQEELADDVVRMADRLSDLTDSMSETDRITIETIEKVDEIRRLMEEVATEEMRELLESIREAMERVSPEDVSEAMENLSITQDDYLKRLEQTLNLLKRAKAEQQLADIADRAEDLAAREERLAREAEQSSGDSQSGALAEEQQKLQDELDKLKEDLARAIEEMSRVDASAAREMAEAAAEMEACKISEKMEQARSKLAESKSSEASEMCQSAANDLMALFTRLSSCQGGMSCSLQKRDREATLRAIDELLGVSSEQEEIVTAVDRRRRIPRPELVELVAKEADLVDAMSAIANRMFQVSKDSFVIDPGIYRSFGVVQMAMTRAASHIASGGSAAGHKEARAALGSVNALIVSLLTSNRSSSGAAGGAMNQLMQRLQQMGEEQSRLNDMTEALRRQMEQLGMSAGMERQLAEMKGLQESILDEARRLAEEFGSRREILGRLDDTVEEMEGTLEEMERSGASQETVDRQKRILSRLLDAQRSLRRRDHTRERTSETAENYVRTGPDELSSDVERVTQELREDLLRAMQRGYPSEYRELIRAYFRGLTNDVAGEGEVAP